MKYFRRTLHPAREEQCLHLVLFFSSRRRHTRLYRDWSSDVCSSDLPAKKLLELVRLLPEGEIKVKLLENHWVEIVSDKKKYKLVGREKEKFPALPVMPHTLVKIPAPIIENLIGKTKFAISMEESRYTLNGGLLILKPDTLAMVATDGHRLALAETDHKLAGR